MLLNDNQLGKKFSVCKVAEERRSSVTAQIARNITFHYQRRKIHRKDSIYFSVKDQCP